MDIGLIFNQVSALWMRWMSATITIYGVSYSLWEIFAFGMIITIIIAVFRLMTR